MFDDDFSDSAIAGKVYRFNNCFVFGEPKVYSHKLSVLGVAGDFIFTAFPKITTK